MKIVIIGETCVDKFIYCNINRLSPEAPVPVLIPIHTETNPGMSGNTCANIKALSPDSQVIHFSNLKQITKTRYVEKKTNHMFLRVDEGDDNIESFKWSDDYIYFLEEADVVIVSDYDKGYLTDEDLIKIATYSKLSILDSKRELTNSISNSFDFVKLNEEEWASNNVLNPKNIIVTLGSKGSMYMGEIFPSDNPQETIDVSGAGDTFTAAFAISYATAPSVPNAIKYANTVASKVVSKRGVKTPA
jgi:D-beta-D-heptose 7-phosphate kinase/D-beta-D-heptose 1-phosphate adenosyltransferase